MMKTKRGSGRKRLSHKEGKRKSALDSMAVPPSPTHPHSHNHHSHNHHPHQNQHPPQIHQKQHDFRSSTGTMGSPTAAAVANRDFRHSVTGAAPTRNFVEAPAVSTNEIESATANTEDFSSCFHRDLLQLGNAIERLSVAKLPSYPDDDDDDDTTTVTANMSKSVDSLPPVQETPKEKVVAKESSPRSVLMNPFDSFGSDDDNLEEPKAAGMNPFHTESHSPDPGQQQQPSNIHHHQEPKVNTSTAASIMRQQPANNIQHHHHQPANINDNAAAAVTTPTHHHHSREVDINSAAAAITATATKQQHQNPFDAHSQPQVQAHPQLPAAYKNAMDDTSQQHQTLPIYGAVPSLDESVASAVPSALGSSSRRNAPKSNPFDNHVEPHKELHDYPFDEGPTIATPPNPKPSSANPFDNHLLPEVAALDSSRQEAVSPILAATPTIASPAPVSCSSLPATTWQQNPFDSHPAVPHHQSWDNVPHQRGGDNEKNMDEDYLMDELHHLKQSLSQSQQDHTAMNGSMNHHPPVVVLQTKNSDMSHDYVAEELNHLRRSMSHQDGTQPGPLGATSDDEDETETHDEDASLEQDPSEHVQKMASMVDDDLFLV
ncbi:expressed unknown protein [Seminavis robusta]|uniref:Uncharacterized protein n=1 Tax=Seminavis robusta TaxID=568900 RepID=A0A9N8DSF1_9STRA|nr:expressed unknown protein [Seminavis robusta]|eukprot:Sro319_g116140.1 n/a (603) ;mRNA; f:9858-11666